jgi:hypothetical protein
VHEDQRGQPQAKVLCRVERRAVQLDALALARRDRDVGVDRGAGLGALETDAGRLVAEPNQPRLRARPRGETLRTDVQRFEQVGLPDPVGADHDDKPFAKLELEGGVRAEAPERDPRDDQPASLIGMIR